MKVFLLIHITNFFPTVIPNFCYLSVSIFYIVWFSDSPKTYNIHTSCFSFNFYSRYLLSLQNSVSNNKMNVFVFRVNLLILLKFCFLFSFRFQSAQIKYFNCLQATHPISYSCETVIKTYFILYYFHLHFSNICIM